MVNEESRDDACDVASSRSSDAGCDCGKFELALEGAGTVF